MRVSLFILISNENVEHIFSFILSGARFGWWYQNGCGSYCWDNAIKHPFTVKKLRNSAQTPPQYSHHPFLKVLEGVGNFFQEVSDKKFVLRLVLLFLLYFLFADIHAVKRDYAVLADEAAGDAVVVDLAQLRRCEIGADDGRLLQIQARVEHVIKAGQRKLVADLCAEVIDDEQIALGVALGVVTVALRQAVAEPTALEIRDHPHRAVVKYIISALDHHACHRGGKMRFSQARPAQKEHALGHRLAVLDGKILGVLLHGCKIVAHTAVILGIGFVIVERKILKRLLFHQPRKPRALHARLGQPLTHATAHFNAHVARVAASLALVLRLAVIGGIAVSAQQLGSLGADPFIFLAQRGNVPRGVPALDRLVHDAQSKGRKPPVQLPQRGDGAVKLLAPRVRLGLRAKGLGLVFGTDALIILFVVTHRWSPFSNMRSLLVGWLRKAAAQCRTEEIIGVKAVAKRGLAALFEIGFALFFGLLCGGIAVDLLGGAQSLGVPTL